MSKTLTVKRADLFKLYLCCRCGNDERMYLSSLWTGIPDGSVKEAYEGISHGEYDSEIDEMLERYERWISAYEHSGFIIDSKSGVINTRSKLLEKIANETDISIPDKIYKKSY